MLCAHLQDALFLLPMPGPPFNYCDKFYDDKEG